MDKKKYIYGLLSNGQGIIGEWIDKRDIAGISEAERNVIVSPAIVEVGVRPYLNPITGAADPKKASVVVNCIPLPIRYVFMTALTSVISYPTEADLLTQTYENVIDQQPKKTN